MNDEIEDIDKNLNRAFQNAALDHEDLGWDAFEDYRKKKKRRPFLYWLFSVGMLFLITATYLLSSTQEELLDKNNNTNTAQVLELATRPQTTPDTSVSSPLQNQTALPLKPKSETISPRVQSYPRSLKSGASLQFNEKIEESKNQSRVPLRPFISHDPASNALYMPAFQALDMQKRPFKPQLEFYAFAGEPEEAVFPKIKPANRFLRFQAGAMLDKPRLKISSLGSAFIHKAYESVRQASETGLMAYGFRVSFGRMYKHFDLGIGLGLNQMFINGNYNFIYQDKPLIDTDGRIFGYDQGQPVQVSFKSKQSLTFVEVPMFIDFKVLQSLQSKSLVHFAFVPQFLSKIQGDMPNAVFMNQKENLSTSNYKSFSQAFEIGYRYSRTIQKGLAFEVMPLYRVNTGFSHSKSYYKNTFHDFGIQCSLRMDIQ